jgi:hypothetical protein
MGSAETTVSGFTQISPEVLAKLTALSADLSSTHDLDLLLNRIMSEARELAQAEAGSIFLLKDGRLRFCYVQNDLLYPGSAPRPAIRGRGNAGG